MVEITELEKEHEYTIETDDSSELVHLYYANSINVDNAACLRFDPLYESAHGVEREVDGVTIMIPYIRVVRIVKRKQPD